MNPKQIALLSDDTLIAEILLRNGVSVTPPTPPDDYWLTMIRDTTTAIHWIILRFYCPGDEGFVAYGLPMPASKEDMTALLKLALVELKPTNFKYDQPERN